MQSILRRFPLYLIVSFAVTIPVTIAVTLAVLDIIALNAKSQTTIKDEQLVNLVIRYDDLAHNLAVERGLTAGVLGSKGNPEIVNNLSKQRTKVDNTLNNLKQFKSTVLPSSLINTLLIDIDKQLARLSQVRQGVDQLQPQIAPFGYYSNLNQLIIDNIDLLISETRSHELSALGKSLISVVIMKERAGQVRGALNGVFARGSASPVVYANIKGYIQSGDYAQRSAKIIMPDEFLNQLSQLQTNSAWQDVEKIQQQFLSQSNTLDAIQGPKATDWFPMATKRIGLLNQLRNAVQDDMQTYASNVSAQSIFNRNLLVVGTAVGALLIGLLLFLVVSGLRHRVGKIKSDLNAMSEQKDLTCQLNSSGHDEISSIAGNINKLISNLKHLLFEVTKTNDHNTERLVRIVSSAEQLERSSHSTIAKCDNIATAMTELAQSSVGIAESAERAMDDTNAMNQQVQACQQQSERSFESVQSLIDQINATEQCMSELANDTQSIGQIVETINGVSEQTNLLALNAAIEAARAGEHGRGFAVVSSEVRDLAQRSQEATENIEKLLAKISEKTRFSVESMTKSKQASDVTFASVKHVNESVSMLEASIEQVDSHISSIAQSTIEQSKACEAIDKDVDILNEIAHQTSSQADDLNHIVNGYQAEADELKEQLDRFKLA
ncbi:methyl-accepting chemotaxis protein [Vibrio panuliri]|uniref:Chemotaxis protein n=1 Tax=Vibrio panuliri TaxID=1381081 RepID=A0ABX3FLP8_9VIBR|nr:methyl-accepting chemotaxis protein [Vibrio panuliri]KAB1454658.1 methyl-accepting chemotaxis protein [Vibrio panuliri]OLQ94119.1 chemotaxis protein [Vibrio panuliri]